MTAWWQSKTLTELTREEWESLCDGCGLCCLHKLEDEDDGIVYTTDVACALLDCATARCSDYAHRRQRVPGCTVLRPENLVGEGAVFRWLPPSCAYRLVAEGRDLPDWHPLVTSDPDSTRKAGHSAAGRCVSARDVPPDELEEHIILWLPPVKG
ncbi:MAG: YcgN family cysteine cluster protein [Pseudomonadota bacterium]